MKTINLADYLDGKSHDGAFAACFAAAEGMHSSVRIVIPPGEYKLSAINPIRLFSGLDVIADGAEFFFPEDMDNPKHRTMFAGTDVRDFSWRGGRFHGHVYDVPPAVSKWRPDACSRCIAIDTTEKGVNSGIRFDGIMVVDCAGAVVTVYGWSATQNKASDIAVTNCNFIRCGKFMWDYGYLWERLAFPELFTQEERRTAERNFNIANVSGAVRFCGDCIEAEELPALKSEPRFPWDGVCFFGENLPPEIQKGRAYYVVSEKKGRLCIAETPDGVPLRTSKAVGARLFRNLFDVFHWAYAPVEQGPGKGGMDLICCRNVAVSGNSFSANGDTMHIKESSEVIFSGNRIAGSRMGAFFLAFDCDHVTATGNVVNGTNGSRVLTVERGCSDVVISGNVFYNGGRGCWFNSNRNLILKDNVFRSNVLKGTESCGRRSPFSGAFEKYPELYFAHCRKGYSNIIVSSNLFEATESNTEPTLLFQKMGDGIVVSDNIFRCGTRQIAVADGVSADCHGNIGVAEINARGIAEPL